MSFPKQQHIVPRFILKNFQDEHGLLHCYRKQGELKISQTPRNALRQGYFYTEKGEDGRPSNDAERRLGELERAFKTLSRTLLAMARAGLEGQMSNAEVGRIREFLLVQFRRSRGVANLVGKASGDRKQIKDTWAQLRFENPLHPKLDGAVKSDRIVSPTGARIALTVMPKRQLR